ncbi:MAG: hypothetical protein GF381_04025, partial [Candidatus Pacebacteria bacterium]|nr:hypothetical protein [Candidatus Paceibacterota bacterium]
EWEGQEVDRQFERKEKNTIKNQNILKKESQVKKEHFLAQEAIVKTKLSTQKTDSNQDQNWGPFYNKSAKRRASVVLAGVVVNIVFAIVAFALVYSFKGIPTPIENQARIGWVAADSPAADSGVEPGYNIVQIQTETQSYQIESIKDVQQAVIDNRGQTLELVVSGPCSQFTCQEELKTFSVYARTDQETPADQGALGIVFQDAILKFYPWWQMPFRATAYGIGQALIMGWLILQALIQLFLDLAAKGQISSDVAGPVGIVYQAQQGNLISNDFWMNLGFAGMLSLNLAVMNLLPIPALDGGRALFIFLEKIFDKKKVQTVERYANYGGFVLLMALILFITFKDIRTIIN